MASINKLSIRGVRAFSPDDEEQVVEFYFPLTIITGANGCGKTTIIESLKYALSGSLPPAGGSRSAGQSFVHDPRSVSQSSVKANIKLRFTNKAGAGMVVIRSMEVQQKKSSMQFKALDGVIRTMDKATGERVTLSHKCSELDRQIPLLLGVSTAILDYVLFVHQEDSSWPLQEAAVLKKRFDDIFDSTRYSKALDSFRKTKKELSSELKDIKANVSGLSSHKHAATGFRKDREAQNQNLEEVEEEISRHKKAIKDAAEEETKWFKIMEKVEASDERIRCKEAELGNLESVAKKQRSMLEKDLTQEHDIRKLKDMLKDFDKEMKKQSEREEELARDCKVIENEIEDLRQKELKLNSAKGKFAAEKEAHEKRQKERVSMMEKINQTYSLDMDQSLTQLSRLDASMMSAGGATSSQENQFSKEDIEEFFAALQKRGEELKDSLRSHKVKFRTQEEEFNSALQELVGKRNAYDNERTKLNNENKEIDSKLKELSKVLTAKRIKKSSIEEFRQRAKEYAKDLEKLTKNDKRDQLAAQLRSYNDKIDKIDEDVSFKMTIRKRLQNGANLKNQIDLLKEQRSKDIKKLKDMLDSKVEGLRSFDIDVPDELPSENGMGAFMDISESVGKKFQEATRRLTEATSQEAKVRRQISQEQGTLQSLTHSKISLEKRKGDLEKPNQSVGQIRRVVKELKDNEYETNWSVEEDDPHALLQFLDTELKRMEENSPEGIEPEIVGRLLKRIKKLEKKTRQCPCCSRGLSDAERKVFADNMEALADPDNSRIIHGAKEDVQRYRSDKAKMESWRLTVFNCMNGLLDYRRTLSELQELAPKLQSFETLLQTQAKELADLEAATSELKKEESRLRGLQDACKLFCAEAGRVEEQSTNINDKIEHLQVETSDDLGEGSLEDLDEEIQKLRDEKDNLYDQINKCNKEVTAFNQEITDATGKVNKTQELLRQKEERYAEEQQATEKKQLLEERKNLIGQETTKLGEQIASLQQKVKAKEAEKGRLYSHANDEEMKLNETLNLFLSDSKHLRDVTKLIEEYNNSNEGDSLDRIASEVAKINKKILEKKRELAELQPELENAVQAINDQERHKKLLNQNIDLLSSQARIDELQKEISQLKEEKDQIDGHEHAYDKVDEAKEQIRLNEGSVARLEGRRSEIIEQIRSLNRKLQSNEYKDVDEQHRAEVIKLETTQCAVNDLDKYANALDKALLRFHSIKIAEINKIIKELWRMTYKGEDITSIELESGQDSRAAKSYNYRVVMVKGEKTKMDMRGRCSAGQRVLASIVIRLALAETFGVMCGCLVLDEPTVNLDENNKRGLASALAQIIANRSKQNNFQLVLITHDDTFVSTMKDELSSQSGFSMPEKYFQVRREPSSDSSQNYYSKIYGVDWDELV